ncbi:MAG: DMT family transporter [Prevotellaceae bacterium]|nr:DMT family transporter [Prevotellaceae bacterium]
MKHKGILLGLLSSGTFGLIPFFSIPLMRGGMGIPAILFYRFLFAAIAMTPVCLFLNRSMNVGFRNFAVLFVLAIFYAGTSVGLIWSYSYIPSGITTTIHFLYPILVAFIMMYCFGEKKSAFIFFPALLSFAGVAFLCWNDTNITLKLLGVYIALATVVTYALYIVGVNKFGINRIHPLIVTFYILSFGAVFFGIYALLTSGIEPIHSSKEWFNLIVLALLPTVISDYALIVAIKYAGSTISAILGVMEPVVAVCMGVCFFAERFNLYSFIGLFLVLSAVIMTIISRMENRLDI